MESHINNKRYKYSIFIALVLPLLVASSGLTLINIKPDEVIAADKKLNGLIIQNNAKDAEPIYASEFILTTGSGTYKLKKDMLNQIASTELQMEINETIKPVVRVLENTAILTGVLHQKGTYKGKAFDVFLNVTDTWVYANGQWKLLAGHASQIPK